METQPIRHAQGSAELTGEINSAYSNGRGIFMPEGNGSPDIGPRKAEDVQSSPKPHHGEKPNADDLRREWNSQFTEAELRDPGTRSTIATIVDMGIGPEDVTSKGPVEEKAGSVVRTAELPDPIRIKRAEKLLGVKLTDENGEPNSQGKAVLVAHWEKGTVYSLSKEQLLKRARILEAAGFTKEQRRILIESGIVASVNEAEAEAEVHKKYLLFTTDSGLKPLVDDANNFLLMSRKVRYSQADHERVRQSIANATSPADYTPDQAENFERAKTILLAELSEKTAEFTGARERADVKAQKEHVTELTTLMKDGNYDGIEAFFNDPSKSDMETSSYSIALSSSIDALEADIARERAISPDSEVVKKHERTIEFTMEYALERIISLMDGHPTNEYPRFNLYQSDNIDRITQLARVYDERRVARYGSSHGGTEMFNYIVSLTSLRRTMHELFRGMKDEKTYFGFVTGLLRKGGLAFVEKQVTGVSDVQIVYEKLLGSALALKKQGWLTDKDFERVDKDALKTLQGYQGLNFFRKNIRNAGGPATDRPMRDWEVRRAHLMGRSLSAASQRRLVYGVLGDVPKDGPISFKSLESEFIARRLALIKLIPERFFGQPESIRMLEILEEELMRDPNTDQINHTKYGYRSGNENRGLYGNSQRAFAFLDTGVVDPKSNSWRGNLMFLRQKGYEINIGGHRVPLGEYLDEEYVAAGEEAEHLAGGNEKEMKRIQNEIFNTRVRDVISEQRLFLGILMRGGNLDDVNKQKIWENTANLLPSRIAAFFPRETLELMGGDENTREARWLELRDKLFIAETARVKNDANFIKNGTGGTRELADFYDVAGITPSEALLIQGISSFGVSKRVELSKITFPFVAFLDDVPETGWDELSDEDYDRILINDQSAFAEGYGHMVGLIAHPIKPLKDVAESFHEAVEKVESPLGVETAQKKLAPFVHTVIRMRESTHAAKWLGWGLQLFRRPRSEIERFNLNAKIADDEREIKDFLTTLAQNDVISDNPSEVDKKGRTMYMRFLDRHKANRRGQLYRMSRIFLMLFGPEFVKAFMGAGVLEDVDALK